MDRPIKNDKVREELEYLARDLDPEEFLSKLPKEITLIEPSFPNVSCEQYVIGTSGFRHSIIAMYPKLDSLKAGDLALYDNEDLTVHIGRIQEDGYVISKWGTGGPVLKHPVDMVPISYGCCVFFRRISEEKLNEMKGKDILQLFCRKG